MNGRQSIWHRIEPKMAPGQLAIANSPISGRMQMLLRRQASWRAGGRAGFQLQATRPCGPACARAPPAARSCCYWLLDNDSSSALAGTSADSRWAGTRVKWPWLARVCLHSPARPPGRRPTNLHCQVNSAKWLALSSNNLTSPATRRRSPLGRRERTRASRKASGAARRAGAFAFANYEAGARFERAGQTCWRAQVSLANPPRDPPRDPPRVGVFVALALFLPRRAASGLNRRRHCLARGWKWLDLSPSKGSRAGASGKSA